ncbi:Os05g0553500 [Oryza sativa Japonica Group]|uniref:Os05g0553500 protein n=1 Tax=Oryza sativa subsp. japonica TaxID=39947 RepID=A0A0N7KL76_ORYSJ|nr:Os05g0553500 [Oryza sativa Japonica Group]
MVDVDSRLPVRPDLLRPCRRSPFLSRSVPAHRRPATPARVVARFAHHLPGPPAGRCGCRITGRFRVAVGDGARCLSLRCPDPSCSVAGETNNKTLAYQIWHELSHSR